MAAKKKVTAPRRPAKKALKKSVSEAPATRPVEAVKSPESPRPTPPARPAAEPEPMPPPVLPIPVASFKF